MIDPAFETLWKHVLDHWDDERAHGVFLEHCQMTDQLAEAAARYRGMKGDSERGALAEKRLAGVAIVALAKLEGTRTQPRRSSSRTAAVILATAFGVTTVGFLVYLLATH